MQINATKDTHIFSAERRGGCCSRAVQLNGNPPGAENIWHGFCPAFAMKPYVLSILFAVIGVPSFSQSMIGADIGIGKAAFRQRPGSEYTTGTTDSKIKAGITYLRTKSTMRGVYLGASLYLAQYKFDRERFYGGNHYGKRISHSSSYVVLAPTIDFTMDKTEVIHMYFQIGFGGQISATETTSEGFAGSPRAFSSKGNVSNIIYTLGLGFSEHIQIDKKWDVVITEGWSIMPDKMTTLGDAAIHPGYLYITAGIARVYKRLPPRKKKG